MNITRSESLRKYLGCPAFQGRPNASIFQDLISRTIAQLEGLKANCLSKVVRIVLIQSHIESLPTHTMQCFAFPQKTSTVLNNLARDFFWKKSNTQKSFPLILRDRICRPKLGVVLAYES